MTKNQTVDRDEVLKIAALAKLHLSEEEVSLYTDQMNEIAFAAIMNDFP